MIYNDLIGIPFSESGAGPGGYNCYSLMREVYRRHGVVLPATNISVCASRQVSNMEIDRHMAVSWEKIEYPEHPCAVLIQSTNPAFADHVAAYIGRGRILHVTMNRAVGVDRLSEWYHKIRGFYRYVCHADNH
jgi:cell wall-associated NlpC family hydrolase